jgi:pimeloyl-ACP methyl ester carboxylesterase
MGTGTTRRHGPDSWALRPAWAGKRAGLCSSGAFRARVAHAVKDADTLPLFVDVARFLRSSVPHVEDCTIDGVGHLLHIQRPEPVARALAGFLGDSPVSGG